ncbi:hypothetical protein WOLCODRAFT_27545 [Wolfiporia cocos MD-104 SS10]|uniref:Uncharacterized protein n=1 Tax=Wolfiporia cocos (strain MD-104) TaxID=742152 RepID=A0A2H3IYB6_WOLCO|nr:hypothetical protein WOLCODRAFT_27545 [Wolfiporia cocos MD-104 SS10]
MARAHLAPAHAWPAGGCRGAPPRAKRVRGSPSIPAAHHLLMPGARATARARVPHRIATRPCPRVRAASLPARLRLGVRDRLGPGAPLALLCTDADGCSAPARASAHAAVSYGVTTAQHAASGGSRTDGMRTPGPVTYAALQGRPPWNEKRTRAGVRL